MSKAILRESSNEMPAASQTRRDVAPVGDRPAADVEMARVLGTVPFRMALDSSGAGIAHWKHEPLHDVVAPMSHHVIMAYNGSVQRMERRSGRSVAIGTFRPGAVIIIPEGSSSRWDIPKPVDVVQLYLPQATLQRVADEAEAGAPADLLERTAHPDPVTSRLLLSAADCLEGNAALPRIQGQHRAFPACLAAPAPARAGHEHAARHRHVRRLDRGHARLRLADRLCRCVSQVDRGIAERLAATRALTAIALQSRQSRWGIRSCGSLGIMVPHS
jgi:hypothetical protein